MRASELMVKCLLNEGVEYIFGLPGEENIEFLDSLSSSDVSFVTVRHEQGASFMADVYGRIKHKPGVCLSTLGPGAMNLATGIANANLDHSPVVALTGQADLGESHLKHHQILDIIKAFDPITKWNARISTPDAVPELVRKAFRIAMMEKQGATHLEIPNDVAGEDVRGKPLPLLPHPRTVPDDQDLGRAIAMIDRSKYPIILAGNGLFRTCSSPSLVRFAEDTGIPVAKTFMSKGSISSRHPMSIGIVGLQSRDLIASEFDKADLVITVGYDVEEYSPKSWNRSCDKKIISVDAVPEPYIDRYYDIAIELVGDISYTLSALSRCRRFAHWDRSTQEKLMAVKKQFSRSFPIQPRHFLSELRAAMGDSDILVSDVGMHKLWISRLFETYEPNTVVISNGLASMGIALPGAIGAKLARPEVNVVSISGDGGFLMNAQELETAKRLGVAGVHVIWADKSYGLIEWKQQKDGKKPFGVRFDNPDFMKLASSFGIKGYRIERAGELGETIRQAIRSGELCIVEVPIDYSGNDKISSDDTAGA
ncbi:MAG: acetolactate synthase large subunit [Candidatus Micrarchaeia archaeon]